MKKIIAGAVMLALNASAVTFDDIHFWVGDDEGMADQKCGIVVEWYGESKCWGYRWSKSLGATNICEIVRRIAREDHRLQMNYMDMGSYKNLYFFGYDVNDVGCQWEPQSGASSDGSALAAAADQEYWSQFWIFYGPIEGATFDGSQKTSSWTAADQMTATDNCWYVFKIGYPDYDESWNESPMDLMDPTPAESPYGFEVVESAITTTAANFKQVENVLGRPTMYMAGTWGGPITPHNPAWMAKELLTLNGENNYVVVKFDHDVVEDPNNPWGIDFIAYGNTLAIGTSKKYYEESSHPGNWTYKGTSASEPIAVEVSQDGKTWFPYSEAKYTDDWAGTQGLVWDEENPETRLYAANKWWGLPTDACYPLDPSKGWSDIAGLTIADLAKMYNGSAGGTGYDLSKFTGLPATKDGKRWIRYVKFSAVYDSEEEEWTCGEIDAVADVAPISRYGQWRIVNYDWDEAWDDLIAGPSAKAPNGNLNAVNAALGVSATEIVDLSFEIAGFIPGDKYHDLSVLTKTPLKTGNGILVKQAESLSSSWVSEIPSVVTSQQDTESGLYENILRVANQGSFLKIAIEE